MTIVAFQGENGAYSQEAAYQFFGAEVNTLPCRTFEDIFLAVEEGRADHGILPVENSAAGSINQAYDLLLERDLKIWGEVILRVRHYLLANPETKLEDIQEVRSHPQALAQCERYLASHGMEPVPTYDTAGSAKELAATPQAGAAVIASELAARIYGLEVLASGIEDLSFNYTRFFILGHQDPPKGERNKTSLVFSTRHVPGALYACLEEFAKLGINLTKLESRPRRTKPWHYVFYLDFEGHWQDPKCEKALLGLLRKASFVKVLGSYPAAAIKEEGR
ncbi:MAG: prephenate dehydratase [Chloroflexi bacterium]|nr:prephenate dehydratase [Chloroflexota bacterium]